MRSRPKHQTKKMPSVVDAKGASAHLILNRAAGNAAALLESQGRTRHSPPSRHRCASRWIPVHCACLKARPRANRCYR
jgi:hypothetical protein